MIVASDVARTAGAGTHAGCGLDHGADHFRMLPHAEIIVGAPDRDVLRPLWRMPNSMRKRARNSLEVGKKPVAPLAPQPGQSVGEKGIVIHHLAASRQLTVEIGRSL